MLPRAALEELDYCSPRGAVNYWIDTPIYYPTSPAAGERTSPAHGKPSRYAVTLRNVARNGFFRAFFLDFFGPFCAFSTRKRNVPALIVGRFKTFSARPRNAHCTRHPETLRSDRPYCAGLDSLRRVAGRQRRPTTRWGETTLADNTRFVMARHYLEKLLQGKRPSCCSRASPRPRRFFAANGTAIPPNLRLTWP